jgi:hypothetical protein
MTITASFPNLPCSLNLDFANSGVLDNRITFTRSTTGAYYNGYSSAVAEQNLLTYSQDYSQTAWTKSNVTITANSTTAPDGTTTAETLTATAGAAQHYIVAGPTYAASTYTLSVYAKTNTYNILQIAISSQNAYANFDLTAGTVGGNAGLVSSSITSAGSSWYRCVITFTNTIGANFNISLQGTTTDSRLQSWTAVGTETAYLWGAQLEQRSSATAYNATTTTAITNYIPVLQTGAINQARFDHNPTTGESLGLLIEEQRTNLVIYSSDFSNANWSKGNLTITTAADIAPDGTQTAQQIVPSASTAATYAQQSLVSTAQAYTVTAYFKYANGVQYVQFTWSGGQSSNYANFDILNGTVTAGTYTTATITSVGNGWYRCSMTSTLAAASGVTNINIVSTSTAARGATYLGNAYSGIYIWGAQLEAGAFATSYIPTVASQVTRSADSASMTGTNFSSWYNISQGTLYCDFIAPTTSSPCLGIGKNTFNDTMAMNTVNLLRFAAVAPFLTLGTAVSGTNKIAATLAVGNFVASNNGLAVVTSTALTNIQQSANTLNIGGTYTGGGYLNGTIKKLAYYPIAVSSANLIALTGS